VGDRPIGAGTAIVAVGERPNGVGPAIVAVGERPNGVGPGGGRGGRAAERQRAAVISQDCPRNASAGCLRPCGTLSPGW